jgi:hypothetical protein
MSTPLTWPEADPCTAALLPAALVGTDRAPLPVLALDGPPGALLAQIRAAGDSAGPGSPSADDPDQAARVLLRSVGVLAICAQAGARGQGAALDAAASAAAQAGAGAETRAVLAEPAAVALLERVLHDGPQRLTSAALRQLDRLGWRLPPLLLPLALEQARRASVLRAPLQPLLGARGRWLAQQHDPWRYAVGAAEQADAATVWSEGTLEQRRALLQAERRHDPAAARERLQATLPELPARERAELLGALTEGLSLADEALLDTLCRDRSREVRQTASALLQRLPGSAFSQRACARVAALLHMERGLLRRSWRLDAPEASAPDWAADGIEPERPKGETLGERAWWLLQLVRQVPPAWWRQHTGLDGAALLAWAERGDWSEALLRGWFDALQAVPDAELADALLQHWPAALQRQRPALLLAQLPAELRERHWQRELQGGLGAALLNRLGLGQRALASHQTALTELLPQILSAGAGSGPDDTSGTLGAPLSAALLEAWPATLDALATQPYWAASWRAQWAELAAALHPSLVERALQLCQRPGPHTETLTAAAAVLTDRQRLANLPAAPRP